MIARPLELDGVLEIIPRKIGDDRGFFSEAYNAKTVGAAGISLHFVQDNHSFSAAKGVLRGLHYQLPPYTQDKLVRVIRELSSMWRSTYAKALRLLVSGCHWKSRKKMEPDSGAERFRTRLHNTR